MSVQTPLQTDEISLLESAFSQSHEGMILTDAHSNILAVNTAFCQMSGYAANQLIGQTPRIMSSGVHDIHFYDRMWQSLQDNDIWQGEIWDRKHDGELAPRHLKIKSIRDENGNVKFYIGLMSDLTEVNTLTQLANQDALTGLANRRQFEKQLEHAIAHAHRNDHLMALLYLDLDRFKHVNDNCGHRIGDELLVQVAQRLTNTVRDVDTVARLGGDEFVIILSEVQSAAAARQVARKIIHNLNQTFLIDNHELNIGCSIGYSIYPEHSNNLHSLIHVADSAMYQAKQSGRNRLCCG